MVFAFFAGCGTFIWLSLTSSIAFGRYLTAAIIFGAILAGRLVGKIAERASVGWSKLALGVAALLVTAGCATSFANSVTATAPVQPVSQLASAISSIITSKEASVTTGAPRL